MNFSKNSTVDELRAYSQTLTVWKGAILSAYLCIMFACCMWPFRDKEYFEHIVELIMSLLAIVVLLPFSRIVIEKIIRFFPEEIDRDVLLVRIVSKKAELKRIALVYAGIVVVCSYLVLGLHSSVPEKELLHSQLEKEIEGQFEIVAYDKSPVLSLAVVHTEKETKKYVGFWGGFCPIFTTE